MSVFSRMNAVINKIVAVSNDGLFCDTEAEFAQNVCFIDVTTSDGTKFSISERDGELKVTGSSATNYDIRIKNGVLTIKPLN